jgi:hypothetical protein
MDWVQSASCLPVSVRKEPDSSIGRPLRLVFGALLVAPLMVLHIIHPAQAQLLDQLISTDIPGVADEAGVTVLSRSRPEYDSLGVRVGSFTIRPQLQESGGYDDNVLGTRVGAGSAFVETNARVGVDYDSALAKANAFVSVDDMRYLSESRQSYTNWTAHLAGSYVFGDDLLTASYDHFNLNQSALSLDAPQLDAPLEYRVNILRIAYKAVFNRVFVQPALSLASYDYDNGTVAGAPYLQNYRNRLVGTPSVTVGYELAPRRNLVVVLRDAAGDYSTAEPGFAKRNFNDKSILGGIDFDADGVWRYRVLVGYESRSFSSSQYKTIQAPIVEGAVIWSPTGLTTVTLLATRHIQDSADETIAAFTETGVRLQVDHEYRRDVLLQAYGAAYEDDYTQGLGSQNLYRLGASATWLLNRNMSLVGAYDFAIRRSGGGASQNLVFGQQSLGQNYTDNRFVLTLRLAL